MSQSQQKTSKKDHTFYNKISLKKPHLFHLTLKTICNRNTAKKGSDFTYFPAKMFLPGVRKNICSAPFCDARLYISIHLLKKAFVPGT